MKKLDLEKLRELEKAGTPGPWELDSDCDVIGNELLPENHPDCIAVGGQFNKTVVALPWRCKNDPDFNNYLLMIFSRNALPGLLAYIAKLEAVAETVKTRTFDHCGCGACLNVIADINRKLAALDETEGEG